MYLELEARLCGLPSGGFGGVGWLPLPRVTGGLRRWTSDRQLSYRGENVGIPYRGKDFVFTVPFRASYNVLFPAAEYLKAFGWLRNTTNSAIQHSC